MSSALKVSFDFLQGVATFTVSDEYRRSAIITTCIIFSVCLCHVTVFMLFESSLVCPFAAEVT